MRKTRKHAERDDRDFDALCRDYDRILAKILKQRAAKSPPKTIEELEGLQFYPPELI